VRPAEPEPPRIGPPSRDPGGAPAAIAEISPEGRAAAAGDEDPDAKTAGADAIEATAPEVAGKGEGTVPEVAGKGEGTVPEVVGKGEKAAPQASDGEPVPRAPAAYTEWRAPASTLIATYA
jgi:hypothetical protein